MIGRSRGGRRRQWSTQGSAGLSRRGKHGRLSCKQGGEVIGDRYARANRWAVFFSGEVEQSTVGHPISVQSRAFGLRPVLTEDADTHSDEALI